MREMYQYLKFLLLEWAILTIFGKKYHLFTDSWIPVSNRVVNEASPNLNFNIITEEDQGIYHCIVTNYDGSVMSDNATITVFGKSLLATHIYQHNLSRKSN